MCNRTRVKKESYSLGATKNKKFCLTRRIYRRTLDKSYLRKTRSISLSEKHVKNRRLFNPSFCPAFCPAFFSTMAAFRKSGYLIVSSRPIVNGIDQPLPWIERASDGLQITPSYAIIDRVVVKILIGKVPANRQFYRKSGTFACSNFRRGWPTVENEGSF